MKNLILGLLASSTAIACTPNVQAPNSNPTPHDMKSGPGLLSGESGNLLNAFKGNRSGGGWFGSGDANVAAGLGVNAFLWRSALETVSFLPLQSADSNGGVIITDWRTRPDMPSERVKATVYIFGTQLTAQAVQVVLFKQNLANGQWVDAPADETTSRRLEDIILTKARDLKVSSQQPK